MEYGSNYKADEDGGPQTSFARSNAGCLRLSRSITAEQACVDMGVSGTTPSRRVVEDSVRQPRW